MPVLSVKVWALISRVRPVPLPITLFSDCP
jgi:hypothetical protein